MTYASLDALSIRFSITPDEVCLYCYVILLAKFISLLKRGRRGPRPGQRGVQDHQKSCVGLVDGERWTTRGMIHSERQRVSSTPPAERIIEPRLLILKRLEKGLRVGDVISGQ
ncbi:hypothetical protein J6590_088835 [Homalodisca vitripennis]|nr:hypothetical protein J6590_088835 [Homalodisca vitripennis]